MREEKPFKYLLFDCLGPLQKSKGCHKYLTVLCTSTHYPASFPCTPIKQINVSPFSLSGSPGAFSSHVEVYVVFLLY